VRPCGRARGVAGVGVVYQTHYHKVAAKVNIVRRLNMGLTHIHSYTSGICLSFLALPRHIQRLKGNTPALPTPIPFDFEELADLIIATDGSVIFGVGYHGWVLSTIEETILLNGGGPDDGIQSLMTSYQSKLGRTGCRSHSSRHTISLMHLEHKVN
jgi:hypothetical protein